MPKFNDSDINRSRSKSESKLNDSVKTGNRIIRADYDEKNMEGKIVLYRGIKPHNEMLYKEQTHESHSVIGPKAPLDQSVSVIEHIEDTRDSSYTSWTPVYEIAKKFANMENSTIMRGVFRKEDLTHPKYSVENEFEYSVMGTVVGAKQQLNEPENATDTAQSAINQWNKESKALNNKPSLKDPLTKSKISHDYTPSSDISRTWEERSGKKTLIADSDTHKKADKHVEGRQRAKSVGDKPDIFHEKSYTSPAVKQTPKADRQLLSTSSPSVPTPPTFSSGVKQNPKEERQLQSTSSSPVPTPSTSSNTSKFKKLKDSLINLLGKNEHSSKQKKDFTEEEKKSGIKLP